MPIRSRRFSQSRKDLFGTIIITQDDERKRIAQEKEYKRIAPDIQDILKPSIKILIADDYKLVADGLVSLLQEEHGFTVGAIAYDGSKVLELARQHQYDICLLDINMKEPDGIETARLLKMEQPAIKIIILTTCCEQDIITRLLQIGVTGYLVKNSTREELVIAIRKVAGNGSYFSDEVQSFLLDEFILPGKRSVCALPEAASLTQREKEILLLLSKEYTNERIASTLHISFRTVETHRKNMMHKTGAGNLAGLLHYAYGRGLLK